jgi:hypothetical protein
MNYSLQYPGTPRLFEMSAKIFAQQEALGGESPAVLVGGSPAAELLSKGQYYFPAGFP